MRLAIFGCGGMGREAADLVRRNPDQPYGELVFATDAGGDPVQGIVQIGAGALDAGDHLVVAVGDPASRRRLVAGLAHHRFATLLAKSAIVAPSASIGAGSIIAENSVINNAVRIGDHVIVNVLCHISHDSIVEDFVTISPRVSCNGWVEIRAGAFIGAGAVIKNGDPGRRLVIGENAVVAAGAVVVRDVVPGSVVMGVPAMSFDEAHLLSAR